MSTQHATQHLPNAIVARVLRRLGSWESSVETPSWTIPYQQLRLPPETPSEPTLHIDTAEQVLRFHDCQTERQFWLDLLPNIDPNINRIGRFQACGRYAFVVRDLETGRLFLRGEACKLRICPVCRRGIQHRSAARVLDFMQRNANLSWQFITLTLKHSPDPLPRQLERLVACFRRLRQRKLWRSSVTAGYAVIEVTFHPAGTWSPNGRQRPSDEWHPHLHVIAATSFIDWSLLRKDWLSITTDSSNIDCSLVESPTHAAHYVAKYIGKPPDLKLQDHPDRAAEYYAALRNRRLLMPFGPTAKHAPPPRPAPPPTQLLCRYADLRSAASGGSYPAQCMLANIILAAVPRPLLHAHETPLLFPERPP